MEEFHYRSIGVIHTPYKEVEGMPIQPVSDSALQGKIEIFPEFSEGLMDLEGFSHIVLLYHFHKVPGSKLTVVPYMDTHPRGVFSTRSPARPNPIGMSVVELKRRDGNLLTISAIDVLDGTPLIDIKPSIPRVDHKEVTRLGWLEGIDKGFSTRLADERFHLNEE